MESVIGSLRGRKCYGAFADGEYRVCVQIRPATMGLEIGELSGGRYARVRLKGPETSRLIAPTFERLAERSDRDPRRPSIEFYRRLDVAELLLPVV